MPPGVEMLQPIPAEVLLHDYSERLDNPPAPPGRRYGGLATRTQMHRR